MLLEQHGNALEYIKRSHFNWRSRDFQDKYEAMYTSQRVFAEEYRQSYDQKRTLDPGSSDK